MGFLFYICPKIAVCALRCCYLFVAKWQTVRSIIGRPSAAVGADLSCPHIWKHPRNGERKRIFGETNMYI